jgi:hypothetical protein
MTNSIVAWSDAKYEDGKLSVPLTPAPVPGWYDVFGSVSAEMSAEHAWGALSAQNGYLRVAGVPADQELVPQLQQHVEAVVQETETRLERQQADSERRREQIALARTQARERDERMTELFRAPSDADS